MPTKEQIEDIIDNYLSAFVCAEDDSMHHMTWGNVKELAIDEIAALYENPWRPIEECPLDTKVLFSVNGEHLRFGEVSRIGSKIWYWGYDSLTPTHFIIIPQPPLKETSHG